MKSALPGDTALAQDYGERILASRILVVDDMEINRSILTYSLQKDGYRNLDTAVNGAVALQKAMETPPDLIILDLVMPEMDGFEFCRRARLIPRFANLPILAQTALSEPEQKMRVFKAGATDYLLKPIDVGELLARVRVHLANKHYLDDLVQYRARMTNELQAARELQELLLPGAEAVKAQETGYGLTIASHFRMSAELGGDCWGLLPLSASKIGLYLFDLAGHGVAAALNAFRLHTLMHQVAEGRDDPGFYLTLINRRLHGMFRREHFATSFYGVIDTARDELVYAAAATPPPIHFSRAARKVSLLDGRGVPLGAMHDSHYATRRSAFAPGDMLLLYSDVLIETPNQADELLREQDLIGVMENGTQADSNAGPHQIMKALLERFAAHSPQALRDDLTISLVQRRAA